MGCACFKQHIIIKSKFEENNNNNNNNNNENNNMNNNENISRSVNIDNNNNINNINIISNINGYTSNNYNQNNFSNFEPYLQSRNDPNFNYPEIENEFIGIGIKKMKGFISHITLEELKKVREEFWSSRIEGDKKIWDVLKFICNDNSLSNDDIKEALKVSGIIPYKNCINIVYDSKGFLYEIPNYCINDPLKYIIEEIEYNKKKPKEEVINVIIRLFNSQFKFKISNWKNILQLKEIIIKNKEFKNVNVDNIRLFFGGKELHNDKELWFYNISNKSICQMLIKKNEILKEKDTNLDENKVNENNNNFNEKILTMNENKENN